MRRAGHRRRGTVRTSAVLTCVLLSGAFAPAVAAAEDTVAFRISDADITESSGLATDEPNQRYWTVNDSEDSGRAYAISPDGENRGSVEFRADVRDVEAVAFRNNTIYVADIGDNDAERDFVTVYTIADPDPGDETREYQAYDFAYPGGPRDAEGFFLGPDGRMYFVSKEAEGAIYRAPVDPSRSGVNELEKVGDAPAYATDAVLLPDENQVAIRTYVSVQVLGLQDFSPQASAVAPFQQLGESMTVSLDGKDLLLGSEGRRSPVYAVPIPTAEASDVPSSSASPPTTSPTASTSPSPSPSPSTTPTDSSSPDPGDTPDDDEATPAPDNGGTMLALGLAGLVAVLAAVVVVVVRKP